MAFIIPDKILENLICDICNKYLSVQPVKVYPNRRIKCGRCVRNKKQGDGVVSLFGLIADRCLFKCINRFDGCRQVLYYSQVREHERICISNIYRCPLCPESDEFTSLLLEQHFHKKHEQSILKYPVFSLNLSVLELSKLFLYRLEDFLFFVTLSFSQSEDNMLLNVSLVGTPEQASNIIQQFMVCNNEGSKISTTKRTCTCYEMENDWFCIKQSNMCNKSVIVKFDLEMTDPQFFKIPCETFQSNELTISQSIGFSFKPMVVPFKPRKIHLSSDISLMHPDISKISIHGTAMILSSKLIFLQCINCLEFCFMGLKNPDKLYIPVADEQQHSLCNFCYRYLKCRSYIKKEDYVSRLLPWELWYFNIHFSCMYECGEYFSFGENNRFHEQNCKAMRYEFCPHPGCQFQANLLEFRNHFIRKHGIKDLLISHYYYGPLNKSFHLFVNNQFILIDVEKYGGSEITITMKSYKNNLKIMALLFDDDQNFLTNFIDSIHTNQNNSNYYLKVIVSNQNSMSQ